MFCWACLGLAFFPTGETGADDADQKTQELKKLRKKISKLQTDLESGRARKSKAEKELQSVEKQIGQASRALRDIDSRLGTTRKRLQQLQADRRDTLEQLSVQSGRLGREARAAYAMGRQQQVKLLLNQEQPEAIGRMQAYFSYFSRARSAHIQSMRETLDGLNKLEREIELETRSLADLRENHKTQADLLLAQKKTRKQLIAKLSSQLKSQGGELKRLKGDEKQLQDLIFSLQDLLADIPPDANPNKPFRELKGELRWPAQGRLAKRFGSRRGDSGLTWQGVVIAAPAGGQVRAVSQGRVAFADWLRGFGLLLIIDHGDGYMSLYGQNQALYKEVGEWVDSGEVVATLGASGGQNETGLYFELRHKGRPVNPIRWCAGKPARVSG